MDKVIYGMDSADKQSQTYIPYLPDVEVTQIDALKDELDDYNNINSFGSLIKTYVIPENSNLLTEKYTNLDLFQSEVNLESCGGKTKSNKNSESTHEVSKLTANFKSTFASITNSLKRDSKMSQLKQLNCVTDSRANAIYNSVTEFGDSNFCISNPRTISPSVSVPKMNNVLLYVTCLPSTVVCPSGTLDLGMKPQLTQPQSNLPVNITNSFQPRFTVTADEEEPLYVNSRQYHRIVKRREARERLINSGRLRPGNTRAQYLHKSRHLHAVNRLRGESGRFLTMDNKVGENSNVPEVKENIHEMETQRV